MTRKSKLIFLILSGVFLSGVLMMIVVLVWENGISEKTVRITASSKHKYKAFMNLGTPPAMKMGSDRSMMTPSSVTEGRSRLGAINPR